MSIDTATEASDRYQQTSARVATERLLERLREHHDYSVMAPVVAKPPIPEVVEEVVEVERKPLVEIVSEIIAEPAHLTVEKIQRTVCQHYNIRKNDLLSSRRKASVVHPRQVGMYLTKLLTTRSFPDIGRRFGGKDHTTVLHAVRRIETKIKTDFELASEVAHLAALLAPPVMEAAE
jgi:hypothetical protein